jgi:hypothetical protein
VMKAKKCANFVNVEEPVKGIEVVSKAVVHSVSRGESDVYAQVVLRSSLDWNDVGNFRFLVIGRKDGAARDGD